MVEQGNLITDPVDRLIGYGVAEGRLQLCRDLLFRSVTLDEAQRNLRLLKTAMDLSQILAPVFARIFVNEPVIQELVRQQLSEIGVPPEVVNEYCNNPNGQTYLLLHLKYEHQIPLETRDRFNEKAAQVIFDTTRDYFGFTPQPHHP